MRMSNRRVVITGTGLITALGTGVEKNWQAMLAGKSGVGPITRFDASGIDARIAAEVKDFDPEEWIDDGRSAAWTSSCAVRARRPPRWR